MIFNSVIPAGVKRGSIRDVGHDGMRKMTTRRHEGREKSVKCKIGNYLE